MGLSVYRISQNFRKNPLFLKSVVFESFPHIQDGHGGLEFYLDHEKKKNIVKLSYPKFGHGTPISDLAIFLFRLFKVSY